MFLYDSRTMCVVATVLYLHHSRFFYYKLKLLLQSIICHVVQTGLAHSVTEHMRVLLVRVS